MGFSGFDSTKGKSVESNKTTAAKGDKRVHDSKKYDSRQYMNKKRTLYLQQQGR